MRKTHCMIMRRNLMLFMVAGFLTYYLSPGVSCLSDETLEVELSEQAGIKNSQGSVLLSVKLEPAKVAAGDQVVVKAVFSISEDGHRGNLPVQYFYEIQEQDAVLFRSPSKTIDVVNGAKSVFLKSRRRSPADMGIIRLS